VQASVRDLLIRREKKRARAGPACPEKRTDELVKGENSGHSSWMVARGEASHKGRRNEESKTEGKKVWGKRISCRKEADLGKNTLVVV